MRYPLIDRFRGALLGALIGEFLSLNNARELTNYIWWEELIVSSGQSLIELGRFDIEHWGTQVRKKWHNCDPSNSIVTAAVIATLPVMLFFHENTVKLRNNLLTTLDIWGNDPEVRDAVLAVSHVVARSLNDNVCWQTLIPQTIDFVGDTPTKLPQNLLQIDRLISNAASGGKIDTESNLELSAITAIELALYYFISSPEDFRLCMLRAHRHPCLGVGIISGILSGTYNSRSGISVNWQIGQSNLKITPSSLTNCSQMLELADALVTMWSGVYELNSYPSKFKDELTIAAPNVIGYR